MEPSFSLPLVGLLTAVIATPVQVLVSITRGFAPNLNGRYLPLCGIGYGFLMSLLGVVGAKYSFDLSAVAQCGMAAVGAQIGAMAAVGLHDKVTKVDEKIQAALDAPAGTKREDVEEAVREK